MEKVLEGKDILKIKNTGIKRTYQNTKEGSPLAGKSYFVFAFGKDAFAVKEDDAFIADLKNGDVEEVTLDVNEEGQFSLITHINTAQMAKLDAKEVRVARKEAAIAGIRLMATKVTAEADVDALLKGL